ncbi:DUF2071 domain-containing protein [Streptomyces longwoodensis]|uniref:DUF2071 domain-containing protein n=1 Tax=Streptomyces longwoodensis TaxID=68231 RepID=UPI00386E9400
MSARVRTRPRASAPGDRPSPPPVVSPGRRREPGGRGGLRSRAAGAGRLTSRRRAYTRRLGLLWETPVEHEPWPLAEASVEVLEETLTRAAGLPAPASAPLVHYSEGVRHVRFGPSRPVGPAAGPR